MKVQTFEIVFADWEQNPQSVYRSGQHVTFNVHLKLLQPVKCRAVYVHLYGNSNVHWTESQSSGSGESSRSRIVHYISEEIYVDQTVAVYTPPRDGPSAQHHPAGEFWYPVTFQLPATAPSSFEGGIGKIRYCIRANIDRPWRFDSVTQKMYTVIRDLDLNREPPSLTGPHSTSNNYDVNCCWCFNCCFGKVRVAIELAKKGFVPGEEVQVRGELVNTSSVDLNGITMELYQRIQFHADGMTRTKTRATATAQLPGLKRQRSMPLDCLLAVHPVPSSRIDGCNNIEVHYFLRLVVDGGCCLSVKQECCELIIGSIPVWASQTDRQTAVPSAPFAPGPTVPAPPSYGECMFGKQEVDLAYGSATAEGGPSRQQLYWAPSYRVYYTQSSQGLPPVA